MLLNHIQNYSFIKETSQYVQMAIFDIGSFNIMLQNSAEYLQFLFCSIIVKLKLNLFLF